MSSDGKWTLDELMQKAEWEGGLYELVTGYGMDRDALSEDEHDEVRDMYQKYWDLATEARKIEDTFEHWVR